MGDRVAVLDLEHAAADDAVQLAQLLDVALDQRRRHRRRIRRRRDRRHRPHRQDDRRARVVFHRQRVARGQPGRQRRALRLVGRRLEGAELGHLATVGRNLLAQAAPGAGDEGPGIGRARDLRRRPHGDAGAAAQVEAMGHERARRRQRQEQDVAVRPGAGDDVVVQRLQRRRDRVPGQLADHDHAEPAVGEERPGDRVARRGVGVGLGGVEAKQLVVGGRQLDELERRQRRAVALAADHELLHRPPARRGDAGQELARRRRRDVVDGDEVGLQVLELLLQRLGRRARDEQLALVAADLPADLFLVGGEVVALVLEELGGEGGLGPGRRPGVGRFVGGARPARRRRMLGAADPPLVDAALARLDARRLPLVELFLRGGLGTRRLPLVGRRGRRAGLRSVPRKLAAVARITHPDPFPFDCPRVPALTCSAARRRGDPRRLSARSVIRGSARRPSLAGGRRPRFAEEYAIRASTDATRRAAPSDRRPGAHQPPRRSFAYTHGLFPCRFGP